MKQKQQDQRRLHLILTTLRQWKKVVLRNQLEREKIRQRGYMYSSGVVGGGSVGSLGQVQGLGQGLWFNEGDQRSGVGVTGGGGDSGGEGTAGGGEGRRVNLIKAKPRPLAPCLIFLNKEEGWGWWWG